MSCFFFFLSAPERSWAGPPLYTLEKTLPLNEGGSCHAGREREQQHQGELMAIKLVRFISSERVRLILCFS